MSRRRPDPAAFARMVRHIPADQLAWRAAFQAKRAVRVGLARAGFATPLAAGTRATPRHLADWPRPAFPVAAPHVGGTLDLHGLEIDLEAPIPWTEARGCAGTDLQRVHLHEHRWIAALDDDALVAIVDDWIREVRPYGPRYWIAAWNGYTLAGRALAWMGALATRDLPAGFVARASASLLEQLGFLRRNLEHDLRGNHLLRDLAALAWGARCFEGPDADGWREAVAALLPRELDHQILADGLHFERSPTYHLQVFGDLGAIWQALPDGPLRDRLADALDRMAEAAAWLTHPDGGPSLFGDGGLSVAPPTDALLDAWAGLGGRRPEPPRGGRLFADGGFAALHRPGEALILRCGPIAAEDLPAHAHADALAFEWSIDGRRVIVDAGTPEYAAGPRRLRCRGTAAHNTVTLDDADQAELFGSFRLGRRPRVVRDDVDAGPDRLVVAAHHDGYAHLPGAPAHHRRIARDGDTLHLIDRIDGGRGQLAVSRLLLHPGVRVVPVDGGVRLTLGRRALVVRASAPVRVENAVWWPDFGEELPTRRLVVDLGPAPCAGTVTITLDPTR